MTASAFPLSDFLPPVARKPKSDVSMLALIRRDCLLLSDRAEERGEPEVAAALRHVVALTEARGAARVLDLGCWRCNGDVPTDRPDLVKDRICPSCADDYDAARAARREVKRAALRAA